MIVSTLTFVPLSVSADAATPTLLTTATVPEGSGSKEDPYKIASAENLLWMSKQHRVDITYGGTTLPGEGTAKNPFAGKYFVQTKDIDLGGKVIPSIGGLNGASKEFVNLHAKGKYSVFGGTYDGQGYSISNGYVINQDPNLGNVTQSGVSCYYYGTGLFGVISGATIKNVTLKNFDIYTSSSLEISDAGLLVGMAVAPISTASDKRMVNYISNCYADSDCNMIARYETAPSNLDSYARHHIWGGLVGAAYRTSISDCQNDADISANNNMYAVGGIVGQMAAGEVVNCVNNGDITVSGGNKDVSWKAQRGFGGIVGNIPYNSDDVAKIAVSITNCANFGNITNDKAAQKTYAAGGILGTTRKTYGELNITGCYNLGIIDTHSVSDEYSEGAIIGGIQFYSNNIESYPFNVSIDNVYSVEIDGLNASENFGGGNYVSVSKNDTVMWSSFNMGNAFEDIYTECFTIGKYGIADVTTLAKKADMVAACDLYVQKHVNDDSYRILATINGSEWDSAGFMVKLTKMEDGELVTSQDYVPVEVNTCYNSISTTVGGENVYVTDSTDRKYIAFVLTNVEDLELVSYEFYAYVVKDGETYTSWVGFGSFADVK